LAGRRVEPPQEGASRAEPPQKNLKQQLQKGAAAEGEIRSLLEDNKRVYLRVEGRPLFILLG
jgi:hypothetical protein